MLLSDSCLYTLSVVFSLLLEVRLIGPYVLLGEFRGPFLWIGLGVMLFSSH